MESVDIAPGTPQIMGSPTPPMGTPIEPSRVKLEAPIDPDERMLAYIQKPEAFGLTQEDIAYAMALDEALMVAPVLENDVIKVALERIDTAKFVDPAARMKVYNEALDLALADTGNSHAAFYRDRLGLINAEAFHQFMDARAGAVLAGKEERAKSKFEEQLRMAMVSASKSIAALYGILRQALSAGLDNLAKEVIAAIKELRLNQLPNSNTTRTALTGLGTLVARHSALPA